MLAFFKKLFSGNSVDFRALKQQGAQVIDVRTPAEFKGGHLKGAKNIPLQSLSLHLEKLNKNLPIITCCASGVRSAAAKNILLKNGFIEVYNGGGWKSLQQKIQ